MSHTRKHISAALTAGQRVECFATGVAASPAVPSSLGFTVTRKGSQWGHTYKRATDAAACMIEMMRSASGSRF